MAGNVSHEDGYFLWYSYVHWNDEHLRDWEGEHPGYDKCPRDNKHLSLGIYMIYMVTILGMVTIL